MNDKTRLNILTRPILTNAIPGTLTRLKPNWVEITYIMFGRLVVNLGNLFGLWIGTYMANKIILTNLNNIADFKDLERWLLVPIATMSLILSLLFQLTCLRYFKKS